MKRCLSGGGRNLGLGHRQRLAERKQLAGAGGAQRGKMRFQRPSHSAETQFCIWHLAAVLKNVPARKAAWALYWPHSPCLMMRRMYHGRNQALPNLDKSATLRRLLQLLLQSLHVQANRAGTPEVCNAQSPPSSPLSPETEPVYNLNLLPECLPRWQLSSG